MSEETGMQLYNVTQHQALLLKKQGDIEKWCLPAGNMRSEALIRHAMHEMSLDSKLQACTPTSIYLALLACAVTGLVPGKMRSLAFLIPFKNTVKNVDDKGIGREITTHEATFVIGWRGVKLTGFRAGLDLVSAVIHQNDDFDFDKGTNAFVKYKPALKGAGSVIGTAAWAKLPRGGLEIEYMDMEALGAVEKMATSKGPSPAWTGPFKDQMQRKSALRRLGKQLEMGEDFHRAELIMGDDSGHSTVSALDIITDGEASRAIAQSTTESLAFGALPPGNKVQVQVPATITEGTRPAQPASGPRAGRITPAAKATVDAQATERPTPPVTSVSSTAPAASSSPSATASASTSSAPASTVAPAASGSFPSKLDQARAIVEAKSRPTASAPHPSAPSASTASASPESNTETSSSVSGETTFGDVAAEPAADEQFDASFGEDPVDSTPPPLAAPPEKSVATFMTWVAACASRAELEAGKAEWMAWSRTKFTQADPESIQMQDAYSKRRGVVK